MFKLLKQQRAQSVLAEYLLVFFLIVGMVSAMTVYFRRAIQARVVDARNFVLKDIKERVKDSGVTGNLYTGYEPYYSNAESRVYRESYSEDKLLEAQGTSGIFQKKIDEKTTIQTNATTLPPKDAD